MEIIEQIFILTYKFKFLIIYKLFKCSLGFEVMSSPKKSNKKSKPKKPKPIVVSEDGSSNDLVIVDEPVPTSKPKPPATTKVVPSTSNTNPNSTTNKKRKKRDSGSSDEERWLTAIESGKLEDVDDELKKIKPKDPALMTARQRAMYDRGTEGTSSVSTPALMSLPTGYKVSKMPELPRHI